MSQRVRATLQKILAKFESGEIPEAIALSVFPIPNIPAAQWSLLNRTVMLLAGTRDARGIRQWNRAGRQVKRGARAFYILAPHLKKFTNEEGEKVIHIVGFLAVPVFRVEDTEGEPLDYQPAVVPPLPLLEVARRWKLSVKAVPGNFRSLGYFSALREEIVLASPEEAVFFHELAHAAHSQIRSLRSGQQWDQETVAELSAAALSYLVGKKPVNLGEHYRYIASYARRAKKDVVSVCVRVFKETERVLNLILETAAVCAAETSVIGHLVIIGQWRGRRVWVNGDELQLEESLAFADLSPSGFNWGYGGSGPLQLALAILLKALPPQPALRHYQSFASDFLLSLPQADFQIEVALAEWLEQHQ